MPRTPRLDLAGVAQHVIQRGNDRRPCFFRDADYLRYLHELRLAALKYECRIHAYVLMSNHVHLLVTPAGPGAIGRMMQTLGRHYVRYFNDTHARSGTLWEGRYKACLVDCDRYLLECYRYIELNPVRAGITLSPQSYRWSSYDCNGLGADDPLVAPHPTYQAIAPFIEARLAGYRLLVAQGLAEDRVEEIRIYTQRQRALGSGHFQASIEQQMKRRAGLGVPGRPAKRRLALEKAL